MRIKTFLTALLALWIGFSFQSQAQVFGGRTKYKVHEVQPKETPYGISKQYGIELEELYKHNPDARKGLNIGDRLLIPQKRGGLFQREEEHDTYVIQPKETLYSLSKKFNISIADLVEMNPELKAGPKIGQEIRVPKGRLVQAQEAANDSLNQDTLKLTSVDTLKYEISIPRITKPLKENYRIAVILPLFLAENDTLMIYNESTTEQVFKGSEIGLDVLMGVQLAIDSMKRAGMNLEVYMFDSKNKPERCVQLARSPLMKTMDLVIGPLFSDNLIPVAGLLNRDSIPVLNLFSKNEDLVNKYSNLWQATASEKEETKALVDYVNAHCPKKNIVLIRQDEPEQARWAFWARQWLSPRDSLDTLNVMEVVADSGQLAPLDSSHFLLDEENIVISLSNDRVFVTDVVSKLNVLRMKNIRLFGFSDIYELSSPDFDYLMHLRTVVSSPYFVDYKKPALNKVLAEFRAVNYVEPGKYGLLAYDISLHALNSFYRYGSIWGAYGQDDPDGLCMDFQYQPAKQGKVNHGVYLLEYTDYEIRVIPSPEDFPEIPVIPVVGPPVKEEKEKVKTELDRLRGINFDQ